MIALQVAFSKNGSGDSHNDIELASVSQYEVRGHVRKNETYYADKISNIFWQPELYTKLPNTTSLVYRMNQLNS